MLEKAKKFAIDNGYNNVRYLGKWKGFEVYEPFYGNEMDEADTGLPFKILSKGNTIRFTDVDEVFECLNHFYPD